MLTARVSRNPVRRDRPKSRGALCSEWRSADRPPLRRTGQVAQTEPGAIWDRAHSERVPLAVSMPSVEDHRRLLRDYIDATEQFKATNEVLSALGRSTSDPDAVLDTVVKSARRLCRSHVAAIYLIEDGTFRLASSVGLSQEFVRNITDFPMEVNRGTVIGRAAVERRVQKVPDVLTDTEFVRVDVQHLGGIRSSMSAPMLLDGEVVGGLSLYRTEVDPFDDREEALLESFAAQAAIVVRNVHLVRALEDRGAELARRLEQMEALSEVGQTVGSSLVLDEVLSNIIKNAVRFAGCDGGSVMEYLEEERCFSVRTAYGSSPELLARLRTIRIELETTLVGRAAREAHPVFVPDLSQVELDPHLQLLYDDGWRSVMAVPVLRDDRIIGALVVRRRSPGAFSEEAAEFLQTFASQSATAVYNAQLFHELEKKSAELEVMSQHKSDFLASMSHELRTPLNAVIGFSEVLLERLFGDLNERQDEYLRDILSSGQHLLALLNEILDLSKVEAGRMEVALSTFSVAAAVEYAVSMVRERAARHSITVSQSIAPSVDQLTSDELRVRQVLVNLLSNAVKFTHDGGRVEVIAEPVRDELLITVRDTGQGIAMEDRERIFESFQQGPREAPKEEGTGLGLTLCRKIVTLLGGRIWLESELGHGSAFHVALPLGVQADTVEANAAESAESREPVVVIIDDDKSSLDLLSAYLTGTGLRVVRARDGDEGLSDVHRLHPAAVVLDIRLPGTDGWMVLERLKATPVTREIPVIIVSILDEAARGLAAGAAGYLTKPVSRDDLTAALRRLQVLPQADTALPPAHSGIVGTTSQD
jgi:signal transduction histidine kinase/ActR/RegA family two-component response regulator